MVNFVVPHAISTSNTVTAVSTRNWVDLINKFGAVKLILASMFVRDVVAPEIRMDNLSCPDRGHLFVFKRRKETYVIFRA